jgi:hypothetical protein
MNIIIKYLSHKKPFEGITLVGFTIGYKNIMEMTGNEKSTSLLNLYPAAIKTTMQ